MTVILGITELALMSADPSQKELLTMVMRSSRQLHALMSDLIDIASLESERMVLTELNFSLSQVIDESVNEQKDEALAKGLQLSQEIATELPDIVRGDAVRLKQIVSNFIENAVKFSESGQITVRAQLLTDDVHSLLLRVNVSDQGIGVSPAQHSRLFQPFVQIDGSSTRKYEGTGLGLALCRRIARLMGGETGVTSVMGSGSTFWATVRLRRATGGQSHVIGHPISCVS
jgi:signal transduction histidine kinase